MTLSARHWTINKKLAALVGSLGFLALIAANPYKGSRLELNGRELSEIVQKEVDHVSAEELAGWIIQGKSDYRLVDLRNEKDFAEYHIPTAENLAITSLQEGSLARNDKIVLYSDGGIHSAQAWFLLKSNQFKGVYILSGGLDEWKDKILFPRLNDNASPTEIAAFEKAKLVSKFFGGIPQVGGNVASGIPKLAMPKLESPGAGQPKAGPAKKKKEGC
ncbi:MAG TPA: rhodanese-like domain-containing protein [Bacteroidota bacterium]